jgi:hypothetical protein
VLSVYVRTDPRDPANTARRARVAGGVAQRILEFAWRSRAVLGNAGVLGLATLPQVADAGVGEDTRRVPCPGVTCLSQLFSFYYLTDVNCSNG